MPENKVVSLNERAKDEEKPFLEQLLQEGARKLLQAAIENEVIDYIQFHKDRRDENGQRLVVRNGHLPEREVVSGVGPIRVRQPRVRHRDKGRFSSAILPKYMRRAPSVDALIPALYLKGISTGDFSEALTAILGEGASGLSPTNIVHSHPIAFSVKAQKKWLEWLFNSVTRQRCKQETPNQPPPSSLFYDSFAI